MAVSGVCRGIGSFPHDHHLKPSSLALSGVLHGGLERGGEPNGLGATQHRVTQNGWMKRRICEPDRAWRRKTGLDVHKRWPSVGTEDFLARCHGLGKSPGRVKARLRFNWSEWLSRKLFG